MSGLLLLAPTSSIDVKSSAPNKAMVNPLKKKPGKVWRAVLHDTILHQVNSGASQLRADGKLFGIASCGIVCTLDTESSDGFPCSKCFPPWPTDQDTQIIPAPLPKRVPRPVPQPRRRISKPNSGWFDT